MGINVRASRTTLEPSYRNTAFLVIECKASSHETTDDGIWEHDVAQLAGCLASIRDQSSSRVFGAIAVGKSVRFYEYDDALRDMNGDGTVYNIHRQCKAVTEKLEYIHTHY